MNKALSIACLLLAALLLFCGCGRRTTYEGISWKHPEDSAMPAAFAEDADVPAYARRWHMPEGFAGFTQRWNARAEDYLTKQSELAVQQGQEALLNYLSCGMRGEKARRALSSFTEAWEQLRALGKRRAEGVYLTYRREADLPQDLEWQDGQSEPELGSPAAKKGGTLRLALQKSFPNTVRSFGINSNNATRRYIYDDITLPLIRLHPGTGHIIPGTADRWALSPDGCTVYFHIDPAARFSDGSKLTARDFITALFVHTSPYALEPFFTDYYLGNFSHIAVYGNQYIAVTLPRPRPYAPYYAAIPAACTPFYAEFGPDFPQRYLWRVEPTTGGYTVEEDGLVMGRSLTLSRVRDWWAADRRFTRYSCNVDNIVYSFINEPTKARELFRLGEFDIFSARDADFWYEGLENDAVHRGFIQRVHFSNIWPRNCFGFHLNCSRPPFDNKNLRLGFAYALNVQLVIETIFRGDYRRDGSYFTGFGPYTDESIRAREYSPEKARAYFAEAGYTEEGADGILTKPDGTRLEVTVSAKIDPLYANCMGMLREEAARCGLDLHLEQMDDTVFYLKVKDKQCSAALFSWGFSPPIPDPAPYFSSVYAYRSDGSPVTGSSNITATASPAMDAAIRACRLAATEEEAVAAQHRVQQLIQATGAYIPAWSSNYWRFAQWRYVRWPDTPECRFCPPRYYDPLDSHLYWIDEQLKKEVLDKRASGGSYPESEITVPLPQAG